MLYKVPEIIALLFIILIEVELYLLIKKNGETAEKRPNKAKHKKHTDPFEKERKNFETLMANLEIYDGTNIGQRKLDE